MKCHRIGFGLVFFRFKFDLFAIPSVCCWVRVNGKNGFWHSVRGESWHVSDCYRALRLPKSWVLDGSANRVWLIPNFKCQKWIFLYIFNKRSNRPPTVFGLHGHVQAMIQLAWLLDCWMVLLRCRLLRFILYIKWPPYDVRWHCWIVTTNSGWSRVAQNSIMAQKDPK